MVKSAGIFAFVLTLAIFWAATAVADTVHLKNGDRISGTIMQMKRGKITIKTDYIGTVSFPFSKVAGFTSGKDLEVYTPHGLVRGPVDFDGNATMAVGGDKAPKPVPVAIDDVLGVNEEPRDYHITAGLDIGLSADSGNTDKQNTHVDGKIVYEQDLNRFNTWGEYNWGEANGKRDAYNWKWYLGYDRYLSENKKWFVNGNNMLEQDLEADLNMRYTIGAAAGYQFFKSKRVNLAVQAGPNYVKEDFSNRVDRDYPAGRWAIDFDIWIIRDWLQFVHNQFGLLSIADTGDFIWQSRTGLRVPIIKNLAVSLKYHYDYNTRPAPGKKDWDQKVMFTLGYALDY